MKKNMNKKVLNIKKELQLTIPRSSANVLGADEDNGICGKS